MQVIWRDTKGIFRAFTSNLSLYQLAEEEGIIERPVVTYKWADFQRKAEQSTLTAAKLNDRAGAFYAAVGSDLNDFTAVRVSMPLDLTGDSDGDKVDFQRKAEQSTLTAAK